MDIDPVRVTADADLTDVALLMADYNLYAIPVVDDDDRVLGVVTVDDVLEATVPEDWRVATQPPARCATSPVATPVRCPHRTDLVMTEPDTSAPAPT